MTLPAIKTRGMRFAHTPIPAGRCGSQVVGWLSFSIAGAIHVEDAPILIAPGPRWFVGFPGGQASGRRHVSWTRDFDARLLAEAQQAGAMASGDPEWPTRLLARMAENPSHVALATSTPPNLEN